MTSMLDALKKLQSRGISFSGRAGDPQMAERIARDGVAPGEIYVSPGPGPSATVSQDSEAAAVVRSGDDDAAAARAPHGDPAVADERDDVELHSQLAAEMVAAADEDWELVDDAHEQVLDAAAREACNQHLDEAAELRAELADLAAPAGADADVVGPPSASTVDDTEPGGELPREERGFPLQTSMEFGAAFAGRPADQEDPFPIDAGSPPLDHETEFGVVAEHDPESDAVPPRDVPPEAFVEIEGQINATQDADPSEDGGAEEEDVPQRMAEEELAWTDETMTGAELNDELEADLDIEDETEFEEATSHGEATPVIPPPEMDDVRDQLSRLETLVVELLEKPPTVIERVVTVHHSQDAGDSDESAEVASDAMVDAATPPSSSGTVAEANAALDVVQAASELRQQLAELGETTVSDPSTTIEEEGECSSSGWAAPPFAPEADEPVSEPPKSSPCILPSAEPWPTEFVPTAAPSPEPHPLESQQLESQPPASQVPEAGADETYFTPPAPAATPSWEQLSDEPRALKVVNLGKPDDFDRQLTDEPAEVPSAGFVSHLNTVTAEGTVRPGQPTTAAQQAQLQQADALSPPCDTAEDVARSQILSLLDARETRDPVEAAAAVEATETSESTWESAEVPEPVRTSPDEAERVMPETTAFEIMLRDNLNHPQLAGQYRAIWKACVEASQGKHHLALAAYGCEPERHTSHVLAQLACLLSQRQSTRILLVDGNLSTQTLSKGFQVTERPGLVEIAAGARDWRECIVETSSPNLFILPAGIGSDQPFLSERVMSGVRALAADFDFVLIDAGVVGDAYMPSLVAASDRSLLVVRLGKTKREDAQAAIATLKQLELGTHGCIVTNV